MWSNIWNISYIELRMWNQVSYEPRSHECNSWNCVYRSLKIQDFNVVWIRDLAIPVLRSNQLSYEATDIGSWSFVGSNEPVRNECEVMYGLLKTHKWPTSVASRLSWLERRTGNARSWVPPLKSWICITCVHDCEDHSLIDSNLCYENTWKSWSPRHAYGDYVTESFLQVTARSLKV